MQRACGVMCEFVRGQDTREDEMQDDVRRSVHRVRVLCILCTVGTGQGEATCVIVLHVRLGGIL